MYDWLQGYQDNVSVVRISAAQHLDVFFSPGCHVRLTVANTVRRRGRGREGTVSAEGQKNELQLNKPSKRFKKTKQKQTKTYGLYTNKRFSLLFNRAGQNDADVRQFFLSQTTYKQTKRQLYDKHNYKSITLYVGSIWRENAQIQDLI